MRRSRIINRASITVLPVTTIEFGAKFSMTEVNLLARLPPTKRNLAQRAAVQTAEALAALVAQLRDSGQLAIERAFAVLAALTDGPIGVTEVADRVALPKSTAARIYFRSEWFCISC